MLNLLLSLLLACCYFTQVPAACTLRRTSRPSGHIDINDLRHGGHDKDCKVSAHKLKQVQGASSRNPWKALRQQQAPGGAEVGCTRAAGRAKRRWKLRRQLNGGQKSPNTAHLLKDGSK